MAEHKARKRFGQNFLQDTRIINDIVEAVRPQPDDVVIEIGPGLAAITEPLARNLKQLHVVEIDRDIIARLKRLPFASKLVIHEGDVLQLDFRTIPGMKKIVGNLPYNISTPLLFELVEVADEVVDMHFMLQKEVVQRLAAEPGGKDYGRLSVMAQYYCHVSHLFDVPPGSFFPPPKVMSAIVRLQPRTPATLAKDEQLLSTLVNTAFQQRRKTLRNTLKTIASEAQILAANIKPDARAETLSVSDFVHLANILHGDIECPASASK